MADVLIVADTRSSPDMRHEVPLSIMDPFLYAEKDGQRHVAIASMEAGRIESLGLGFEVTPYEALGREELVQSGLDLDEVDLEVYLRACRSFELDRALVPPTFPTAVADRLRASGVELVVDSAHFHDRRRVKTAAELEGIRRAQRAAEAAMGSVRDALARAERRNGNLVLNGEELTCELLKRLADQELVAHGASADELIVSHGSQTAVGHDSGSGAIAPDDVVLIDVFPLDKASACYADMTRTFAVGSISDEIATYHRLAREALDAAVAMIRPGVNGTDVHRLVCELFAEHGYPTSLHKEEGAVLRDGFYHATGHGVGLGVHEAPYLSRTGHELVAGDVIALEPGLYRHGFGGVRLEDLLLVTEDGSEVLTDFPYDLEVPA